MLRNIMTTSLALTWNEALSGVFGSISLAAWIFLLVPQLIENYQQGSADGISLTFLLIWAAGDVLNLAGALWAGLVPTVIALAVYFCFADTILILQCVYYNTLKKNRLEDGKIHTRVENNTAVNGNETTPLLNGGISSKPRRNSHMDIRSDNLGLPGSRRRSSATSSRRHVDADRGLDLPSNSQTYKEPVQMRTWLKNVISILAILVAGSAGWAIAWKTGAWRPSPVSRENGDSDTPFGAEVLGYASAVLYLGARIPQIIKNQRERSCEGLSLLFFILSVIGNATYGAGILFHSVQRGYLLTNLPWLLGSLGTMAEDAIIFIQFSVFGEANSHETDESAET